MPRVAADVGFFRKYVEPADEAMTMINQTVDRFGSGCTNENLANAFIFLLHLEAQWRQTFSANGLPITNKCLDHTDD